MSEKQTITDNAAWALYHAITALTERIDTILKESSKSDDVTVKDEHNGTMQTARQPDLFGWGGVMSFRSSLSKPIVDKDEAKKVEKSPSRRFQLMEWAYSALEGRGKDKPKNMTQDTIRDEWPITWEWKGFSPNTFYRTLCDLHAAGVVTRVSRGTYALSSGIDRTEAMRKMADWDEKNEDTRYGKKQDQQISKNI